MMNTNKTVITVITTTLAILAGCCVITICLLSYFGIQIPPELNTLTGTLTGAIGGMLVKTSPTEATKETAHPSSSITSPAPVQVMNTVADPVPTENQNP